ncbi:MAG: Fic family protein [Clostridia bacterium]|nr:Fic family protein [Clostridia bacterium]
MYSYKKLDNKLSSLGLTKTDLSNKLGISSRTIAKMAKGEKIADHVLNKIASFLNCRKEDIVSYICDNHILQILRDEKNAKISGGLYHELQIRMTYNSNHMEGSKLSEDQTRLIFDTRTIDAGDGIPVDDIIETSNHFRCIDYAIDVALEPLSEDIIKHFHLLLKRGTKDSMLDWFRVGDYKRRANVVGGRETCKPADVPNAMQKLIGDYLSKPSVTIDDIIKFHADFEYIHPFQDGNGRVGRLIAFKECLRWNIIPFLIEDAKKSFYYRGLSNWKQERGWLIDTCLDGQDTFRSILQMFDIPENGKT